LRKHSEIIYNNFMELFDMMPIAALISTPTSNYFALHGGLTPSITKLEQINEHNRFCEPQRNAPLT
jgi:serine/threonine-protein phosphatase 2B catalytic subunit